MGRLRDKMPVTALTFLIGTLALCGLFPLSGFYSKDAILAAAYEESPGLFLIGGVVAALTTFYMFRLVFVVFWGRAKSDSGPRPRVAADDDLSADRTGHRFGGRRRFGHSAVS
jgi:NADH:ubiquinone oxidoreductase subunit 5 (subunit L)/multisubunit Na+/H+ antiporter MnhA subunit